MDSDLEERMVAVTGEKEGGRQAREGAVSEAGFIISTGWEEAMPTQGSCGARGFLQPEGLAVPGTKTYSSGSASQAAPVQWWTRLALQRQRQDWGCEGAEVGTLISFLIHLTSPWHVSAASLGYTGHARHLAIVYKNI